MNETRLMPDYSAPGYFLTRMEEIPASETGGRPAFLATVTLKGKSTGITSAAFSAEDAAARALTSMLAKVLGGVAT